MKIEVGRLIEIAIEAGEEIMKAYYAQNFSHQKKKDDSPVTLADRLSNDVIIESLKDFGLPIISEEIKNDAYEKRKNWTNFFVVDPLDGTKEFINKKEDFTVNIAYVEKNTPLLGVVYAPAKNKVYFSDGLKSYVIEGDTEREINSREQGEDVLDVVVSRSHLDENTSNYIDFIKGDKKINRVDVGSSLKFCLVAEGEADVYPRLGPKLEGSTMEWDTAAAHAVVKSANKNVYELKPILEEGKVVGYTLGEELVYNKENLRNPWFVTL